MSQINLNAMSYFLWFNVYPMAARRYLALGDHIAEVLLRYIDCVAPQKVHKFNQNH